MQMPHKRCSENGCTKFAQHSKTGNGIPNRCKKHGGGDRCQEKGCKNSVQRSKVGTGRPNRCKKHGGGDRCEEEGCGNSVATSKTGTGRPNRCVKHGGGDRCEEVGCKKSARKGGNGTPNRCKKHGGGDRCEEVGCGNSVATSKTGTGRPNRCVNHGGGDRCEEEGCGNSVVTSKTGTGRPNRCVTHGGGDRCVEVGCTKSAERSKTGTGLSNRCGKHGGGDRCVEVGCGKLAVTSNTGTGLINRCKAHGGGDRCEVDGCDSSANVTHPTTGKRLCRTCARCVVSAADDGTKASKETVASLMKHFRFKVELTLRIEHCVRHAFLLACPAFVSLPCAHDKDVLSALGGKRKSFRSFRPDMYAMDPRTNFALHVEIDEEDDHEDSYERIRAIEAQTGVRGTYLIRIRCRRGTPEAVCRPKRTRDDGTIHVLTARGTRVVADAAAYAARCLEWMKSNIEPTADTRKAIF